MKKHTALKLSTTVLTNSAWSIQNENLLKNIKTISTRRIIGNKEGGKALPILKLRCAAVN